MQCPNCEEADLIRDTRDIPYTYKGESTIIPQVTGDFCPVCGEGVLEMDEARRSGKLMLEFNKQVNAGIVDPEFITSVRKKLDLDQSEAAKLFGGSVKAFSMYETGRVKPPVELVKLFKLLERHPELLAEIRTA